MILLLAAFACAAPALAAPGSDAPIVHEIEVRGLARVDEGVVLDRISTRLGEPLDMSAVTRDIQVVFASGYFQDVQVQAEPFDGGLRLIYVLSEKPTIRRIQVFGNEKVTDDALQDEITIAPGAVADMALIQDNARKLKALYEKKRYMLARVVPVIRRLPGGHVMLTYHIDEGEKVRIGKIKIEGSERIRESKYMKAMKTSEWWFLSWLTSGGKYSQGVMEEDLIRISDLMHDNGLLKSKVGRPELSFRKNRRWLDVTIKVKEGDQYTVGDMHFIGNSLYNSTELMDEVRSEKGEVFSRKKLRMDIESLSDMHTSKGYALASVYPDIRPNDETKVADIVFMVSEGMVFFVDKVTIFGNTKTRDKVIRREIRLNEGEQFDGKKFKRSYQMLANLNYFSDIRFQPIPDPDTGKIDLGVTVVEQSTGTFNVGIGYGSAEVLLGMFDVTFGNFRGAGQTLKMRTEFSEESTLYDFSFREPWLFDKPIALSLHLFRNKYEYDTYVKRSTGFSIGLSRSFKEYWRTGATYAIREDQVNDVLPTASLIVQGLPPKSMVGSISPYISYDARDNYLNPHEGRNATLSLTYAGIGGDIKFYKISLDAAQMFPVTKNTELALRGRVAAADGYGGKELPEYERYFVGGPYTVRGLREIGPHDATGNYLGGKKMLIMSLDYTFPLSEGAGIKGDIFFDAGTAYDDTPDIRMTSGAGIKWMTPMGPIMFFWAKNLDQREGELDYRWEFAIGALF